MRLEIRFGETHDRPAKGRTLGKRGRNVGNKKSGSRLGEPLSNLAVVYLSFRQYIDGNLSAILGVLEPHNDAAAVPAPVHSLKGLVPELR